MIDEKLFQDTPLDKRAGYLSDNARSIIKNYSYTRTLEKEEQEEAKHQLFQADLEMRHLEEEKKEVSREYSEKLKTIKEERNELIEKIEFNAESEKGTVYEMDYQQEGMMGIYNKFGNLIHTRPLTPEERQTSIMSVLRDGTND